MASAFLFLLSEIGIRIPLAIIQFVAPIVMLINFVKEVIEFEILAKKYRGCQIAAPIINRSFGMRSIL